ncbi:hypothetical protein TSUD_51750 [Trifolium subterraneum]|uniref:Uncharacterized protein n=1 Tax=Trifolium subterraneum TaxID=3900 RepID=A0A2Z6LKU8_TRISU|nr:hypothetical protein TSUD_51750 [Trifolium subterraneum]
MDVAAKTLSSSDDTVATQESDTDFGAKTASLKYNDVAVGYSSSVKPTPATTMFGKMKKKRGRKSFAEIQKMEEEEENVKKRGRKKKVIVDSVENDVVEEGENVKKEEKKKPGRKRKKIFSSGEEFEAEQKGENVIKEKKKPGRKRKVISEETELDGENGGFIKEEKNKSGRKIKIVDEFVDDNKDVYVFEFGVTWFMYPKLKESDIAEACPVCRDNCNCIACLRSSKLIDDIQRKRWNETDTVEEVRLSKYLLEGLFPYLRQLDGEQMIEKEREAKRLRISLSKLKVKVADYPKNKHVYW